MSISCAVYPLNTKKKQLMTFSHAWQKGSLDLSQGYQKRLYRLELQLEMKKHSIDSLPVMISFIFREELERKSNETRREKHFLLSKKNEDPLGNQRKGVELKSSKMSDDASQETCQVMRSDSSKKSNKRKRIKILLRNREKCLLGLDVHEQYRRLEIIRFSIIIIYSWFNRECPLILMSRSVEEEGMFLRNKFSEKSIVFPGRRRCWWYFSSWEFLTLSSPRRSCEKSEAANPDLLAIGRQ